MQEIKNMADLSQQSPPIYSFPLIGEPAPPFKAESTLGPINFPEDYKGKWVLLFSYPADFCTVCTTELLALAENSKLYKDLNVELVGLSVDSLLSHFGWLESIYRLDYDGVKNTMIDFPLVADHTMEIARRYGILRKGEKDTRTVRAGFLVDPEGKIRASIQYPLEVARSGDEIRRLVQAVLKTEAEDVYTPANWRPGDDVLVKEPNTINEAIDNLKRSVVDEDVYCPDWFLCYKKDKDSSDNSNNSFNSSNYYKPKTITRLIKPTDSSYKNNPYKS